MVFVFWLTEVSFGDSQRFLDGVWRSQGYGYVFEIRGPVFKAFELTQTTCVLGFTAQRQAAPANGREATFKSKDEGVFFVKTGGLNDHKLLHQEDAVADVHIDRIENLPPLCDHPTTNTPPQNFEVFTRTFAEQYISFEQRHIDWNRIVAEYRPKVDSSTTPQQLFDIFEAMVRPLGDIHTFLAAPALKKYTKQFWRPGTDRLIKGGSGDFANRGRWTLFSMIDQEYLRSSPSHFSPRMFCKRHLQYGHLDEVTGYLRILSFGGYSKHNDLGALEKALDSIFSDPNLKALVIDMRLCFGGSDELGLAIASRLATAKYLAYTVQARSDPVDANKWTPGDPVFIRPSSRPSFRGPVVVLTGPITMSAAESFVQALMGRPHVTRIGESTQGVFCDVLDRHLPNGWSFGLPNAVYRAENGKAFDVTGIPPDANVPVFADVDVTARRDVSIEKAKQLLQ
jgi:hypothetical protein